MNLNARYHAPLVLLLSIVCGCTVALPNGGKVTLVKGIVTAETVIVSSGATGEVTVLNKEPGDRVTKGELVIKLDSADSAGDLAKARETVKAFEAEEKNAKEELDRTTAELSYSAGRYQTFSYLLKKGAVAPRELDRLKDEWEFAGEQHEKAQIIYDRASKNKEDAERDLALAEKHLGSVLILAPENGYITRVLTWKGGYLLYGEEAVIIAAEGEIYLTGAMDDRALVSLGDKATILPLAFPTGLIPGYVARIDGTFTDNTVRKTMSVRLFPSSRKDVINIGKKAWAVLYTSR